MPRRLHRGGELVGATALRPQPGGTGGQFIYREHGIVPSQLCLEITETALIGELGEAATTLAALSKLGVLLALDDFGTGYSTLAHVQRLNVDILKIDRSFVEQIGGSDRDREIIGAITAMAHALGMLVVGEGIETERQLGS